MPIQVSTTTKPSITISKKDERSEQHCDVIDGYDLDETFKGKEARVEKIAGAPILLDGASPATLKYNEELDSSTSSSSLVPTDNCFLQPEDKPFTSKNTNNEATIPFAEESEINNLENGDINMKYLNEKSLESSSSGGMKDELSIHTSTTGTTTSSSTADNTEIENHENGGERHLEKETTSDGDDSGDDKNKPASSSVKTNLPPLSLTLDEFQFQIDDVDEDYENMMMGYSDNTDANKTESNTGVIMPPFLPDDNAHALYQIEIPQIRGTSQLAYHSFETTPPPAPPLLTSSVLDMMDHASLNTGHVEFGTNITGPRKNKVLVNMSQLNKVLANDNSYKIQLFNRRRNIRRPQDAHPKKYGNDGCHSDLLEDENEEEGGSDKENSPPRRKVRKRRRPVFNSPPPASSSSLDSTHKNSNTTTGRYIHHFPSYSNERRRNINTTTPQDIYPNKDNDSRAEEKICNCSKSKCLKLYCDCFQAGQVCNPEKCTCKSCLNTQENSGVGGLRTKAIEAILARRPDAFDLRVKKTGEGCSCKKNKCLKKYCDCFNSNLKCTSRCRCIDCHNGKHNLDDSEEEEEKVCTDQEERGFDKRTIRRDGLSGAQEDFVKTTADAAFTLPHTPIRHQEYNPYFFIDETAHGILNEGETTQDQQQLGIDHYASSPVIEDINSVSGRAYIERLCGSTTGEDALEISSNSYIEGLYGLPDELNPPGLKEENAPSFETGVKMEAV